MATSEYRGVGLNGGEFISDTTSHTGRWFSIVSLEDTTQITSISGNITNLGDATTGGGSTVTLTKNTALYGAFDEITLAAGSVIAYNR
jgi:hypothetical protein